MMKMHTTVKMLTSFSESKHQIYRPIAQTDEYEHFHY